MWAPAVVLWLHILFPASSYQDFDSREATVPLWALVSSRISWGTVGISPGFSLFRLFSLLGESGAHDPSDHILQPEPPLDSRTAVSKPLLPFPAPRIQYLQAEFMIFAQVWPSSGHRCLDDTVIHPVPRVRNLGSLLDTSPSFTTSVSHRFRVLNSCRSAAFAFLLPPPQSKLHGLLSAFLQFLLTGLLVLLRPPRSPSPYHPRQSSEKQIWSFHSQNEA